MVQWIALVIALLNSIFTVYQAYYKPYTLNATVGDRIGVASAPADHPFIYVDLTLVNRGAEPAVLVSVRGILTSDKVPKKAVLHWAGFYESVRLGEPGITFKPYRRFRSGPSTTLIEPRHAVANIIGLLSERQFELVAGEEYALRIMGFSGQSTGPHFSEVFRFKLTHEQEHTLRCDGVRNADGIIPKVIDVQRLAATT